MRTIDKEHAITRYCERLKQYGYDPRTLGWNKGRQEVRFKALTDIGDFSGCSVLDVGCGFGDLFGYLKAKGYDVTYTGIDLNPELIEVGKKIYPEADFRVLDFEDDPIEGTFDWVIESGIFNYKLEDNWSFIAGTLKKMLAVSNRGVAADFMSSYVDFTESTLYYAKPEEIYSYCKSFSRRVTLRSDYMPFEFAVHIYKNDQFNQRVVFSEFDDLQTKEKLSLPFLHN